MIKKVFFILPLLILVFLPVWAQLNVGNKSPDDGSIHALGNGKMCIYEKGTDIVTAYTGQFSSPSFMTLQWIKDSLATSRQERKLGSAIWTHILSTGNVESGNLLDFVDAESSCFVRKVQTKSRITLRLNLQKYVHLIKNSGQLGTSQKASGMLMVVPSGTIFYQSYSYPRILYSQLALTGNARIEIVNGSNAVNIICEPGESTIFIVGGLEYDEVMTNTMQVLSGSVETLLERTNRYWQDFTKGRKDYATILPASTPERARLLQTIDDVAVLLKSQQSVQGAEIAGYPYPLGYVRDQYGVSRGLLALGMYKEAKSVLNFYWKIWEKYGLIHNAQAIGIDGVFHIHENDQVESPGYLIIQAFDLLKATKDSAFVLQISPMLDWAFSVQQKYLVKNMLPFNGDETYVAGGLLPRSTLNDGSAESTLLFIESGQKYMNWLKTQNLQNADYIVKSQALIDTVKAHFMENFWQDGVLWTNNPLRAELAELPHFRHGVCESAGPGCLMNKYGGIVWTERNENNRYVCAACISRDILPKAEPTKYNLLSVAMAPFYMGFSTIPYDMLKKPVTDILNNFKTTGAMTSKQATSGTKSEIFTVGYDYGFLLSALTKLNNPDAMLLYHKTLSVVDNEGAWAEYYLDDQPKGTRCRPWESAINLEALIGYAMKRKQE